MSSVGNRRDILSTAFCEIDNLVRSLIVQVHSIPSLHNTHYKNALESTAIIIRDYYNTDITDNGFKCLCNINRSTINIDKIKKSSRDYVYYSLFESKWKTITDSILSEDNILSEGVDNSDS